MEGKKSTSRHSKGGDPSKGKKDSGSQKPLKKTTSARKAPRDEEDDDAEERPAKKGASGKASRGSARQGGAGGAPRVDPNAERMKKVFLSVTPILMILLLAIGWKLSQIEPEKPKVEEIRYDKDIEKARQMYSQAKAAFDQGMKNEQGGLPKLKEAKKLCEDAKVIIDNVRNAVGEAEQKTGANANPKEVQNYEFETLDQQLSSLLVMCRKTILERE